VSTLGGVGFGWIILIWVGLRGCGEARLIRTPTAKPRNSHRTQSQSSAKEISRELKRFSE
jgi:hypothetical protein